MARSFSFASLPLWRWMGASMLPLLGLTGCSPAADKDATQAATAAAASQGSANLAWDGQRITLTGEVGSDADKQKLLSAAATTYGAGNVVDQLKVVKGLGRLGGITLNGTAIDDADKSRRVTSLADALPMVPVENRLTVATLAAPAAAASAMAAAPPAAVIAAAPATAAPASAPATPQSAATPAPDAKATAASVSVPAAVATAPTPPPVAGGAVAAAQGAAAAMQGAAIDAANCARFMALQVTFAPGSARVNTQNQVLLRQSARCIAGPTQVAGYTDDRGSASTNASLSQARALAVVNLLVQNGAKRSLLTAKGFGSDKPVADNSTDEGRAKNRRIELTAQ